MDIVKHLTGISEQYTNEHRIKAKNGNYIRIPDRGKIMGHYSRIVILIIKSLLLTTFVPCYSLSVSGNDHFAFHNDLSHLLINIEDADTVNGSFNYDKAAPPNTRLLIPGIASLAVITFLVDEPVVNYARTHQTSFLKSVAHYTDAGGEKKIVVPGVLLTYVTARFLMKDERLKNTTLNSIQSIIVTAIATEGIKYLAGRARPFTGEGAYLFQPFPGGIDRYKSLPSGHTSLAFALFTPYAETYSRWIYLVPVSVAFGRVYQDKHWLSDVVTGGGIGLISGILFTHYENIQIIPNGLRIYF